MDGLGIALSAALALALIAYATVLYRRGRNLAAAQRAERTEVDGSILQFAATRKSRADRAVLAQRDRWSRHA